MSRLLLLLALLLAFPAQVSAQEVFGGVYSHGVTLLATDTGERGTAVALGYRLPPAQWLKLIGRPQPYVLASVHTGGETSFVAAGLSWKLGKGRFFVRPAIGVAIHNGPSVRITEALEMYTQLGSRVLFEPEIAVGVKLSERATVEASWMHLSHGKLASAQQNPGLDQIGLRFSLKLGAR